ncbi:MAG: ketoacyl-ACP synthase III [Candidatus Kerfeldbacteria bacterium]|nr:ketoacyl-ACP synthase III [Candidatus Kerfeldbacteria bacterium]
MAHIQKESMLVIQGVEITGVGSHIIDPEHEQCKVRAVSNPAISESLAGHERYFRGLFQLLRNWEASPSSVVDQAPLYDSADWRQLNPDDQITALVLWQKYRGNIPTDADPRWIQFDALPDKIFDLTGIRSRYWALPGVATSDLGKQAAEQALAVSGLNPESVGFIMVATTTPDHPQTPLTATRIKGKLGIQNPDVFCIDVTAACTSYASAMQVAYGLIASGQYKSGLVIGADVMSGTASPYNRNLRIVLGDGAFCAVLEACPIAQNAFIPGGFFARSDPSLGDLIVVPAGGSALPVSPEMIIDPFDQRHLMFMDGHTVRKRAERMLLQKKTDGELPRLVGLMAEAAERAGLLFPDIDFVAMHQANLRIINPPIQLMREFGFAGQVHNNIERFGNTTSASGGLCLDEAWQCGELEEGDLVEFVAFGGGMTAVTFMVRWTLGSYPSEHLPYRLLDSNRRPRVPIS